MTSAWISIARRITSYNVCYTKLLRIAIAVTVFSTWITLGSQKTLLHRFATQTSQVLVETIHNSIIGAMESGQTADVIRLLEQINSVITSYSIHYTKLYDSQKISNGLAT